MKSFFKKTSICSEKLGKHAVFFSRYNVVNGSRSPGRDYISQDHLLESSPSPNVINVWKIKGKKDNFRNLKDFIYHLHFPGFQVS